MAKPTTETFGKFVVEIETAVAGVYHAPCGLTTKGLKQSASTQDTIVPDCDNPDAPADVERAVDALSREISGAGVLAMESRDTWQKFYDSGASKNCRVTLNDTLANHGGYWLGKFVLTTFDVSAQRGKKIEVQITLQSDGAVPWTDADA